MVILFVDYMLNLFQADLELRATIMKVWPVTRAGKIDLLVPTEERKYSFFKGYMNTKLKTDGQTNILN